VCSSDLIAAAQEVDVGGTPAHSLARFEACARNPPRSVDKVAPMNAGPAPVELPGEESHPLARLGRRLVLAVALTVFVAILTYLGRDGYVDAAGGEVGFLDALYYSTVSITTTGYGDIRPETTEARLVTTLLITPARVLFLILLVGTTLELLAERTRTAYRLNRWRRRLEDHIVICGFGTKGRAAVSTLEGRGVEASRIVVIEPKAEAREQARAMGLATIAGNATSAGVLESAGVARASAVVVAPDRDDAAVLITLTARELNRGAMIVSAVREEENAHLLRESGANSVITSSGAAGRLLGMATQSPQLVEVLEDLLSVGQGLDIVEREVGADEAGPLADVSSREPVVAVVRDGELMRFDDERAARVAPGDRLVCLTNVD
jgi:voltage-gated potassium channel